MMWYGFVGSDRKFKSVGGSAKHERIPNASIPLTEVEYTKLKNDIRSLWYYQKLVQPVDPQVILDEAKRDKVFEILADRDKKISVGLSYTFPDGIVGTIPTRTSKDILNITGLGAAATAMLQRGLGSPVDTFGFNDAEGKVHQMTPHEIISMGLQVQMFVSQSYDSAQVAEKKLEKLTSLKEVLEFFEIKTQIK